MKRILHLFLLFCSLLIVNNQAMAQVSSNIAVSAVTTPDLTPCSGTGTFVVRVKNNSLTAISNLVFKDAMPSGINYVSGSVSGTGVTFGSVVTANNVVNFNIASIPASGQVDISFTVETSCSVSSTAANIYNTYSVTWSTFSITPFVTPTYNVFFPSLSITPAATGTYNASCLTPFVRDINICNGGFGSVDSVTFTDVESNSSLIIQGFSAGTQTGLGTQSAKTVLKAADFMLVGNLDGKLDQNECLLLHDTVMVVGSTSPINGTLKATWGCNGNICTNPASNTYVLNTTINAASPLQPLLTHTGSSLGPIDSAGQIYGRPVLYREVIKNNSSVIALNVKFSLANQGMKYADTASILYSKNGGPTVHPTTFPGTGWAGTNGTVNSSIRSVVLPTTYTGKSMPNSLLDQPTGMDLAPGDSLVVTYTQLTAGPIIRVNQSNYTSPYPMCNAYYVGQADGPAISRSLMTSIRWDGCPAGTFQDCTAPTYNQSIFNGLTTVTMPAPTAPIFLARFRSNSASGYSFTNESDDGRCAFYDLDTIKARVHVDIIDIPFYTDKSKLGFKVYTNGGMKWDGNLSDVWAQLTSLSGATKWQADYVIDNTAIDSTISFFFKRSAIPNNNFGTYNTYSNNINLHINFVNLCPGPAQKRFYITRLYNIDTTNAEPSIEAGPTDFPPTFTWNSNCPAPCSDGVSILKYEHNRTTFGAPDNNQDGIADVTGTLDMTKVSTKLITWGDTLQLKYKMVVHSTNPGGAPSLYVNSSINYSVLADAITANNFITKDFPRIELKRGATTYTGTGTSIPVNTDNFFLANLSLQGAGGVSIPGVTTYMEGDTVELTQNLIYFKPHSGWDPRTWSFLHVPFTANVISPTVPQRLKCDSVVCNFQTVDMKFDRASSRIAAAACSDSVTFRMQITNQPMGSGCGTNYFPFEARNVYTPTNMGIVIPAASQFEFKSVKFYLQNRIAGSTNCGTRINGVYLPPTMYSISGDTVKFDFKQIATAYGQDLSANNLYNNVYLDINVKYNLLPSQSGCTKDHIFPQAVFNVPYRFETSRPMDTTGTTSSFFNGVTNNTNGGYGGNAGSAFLELPGTNNNTPVLYAGTSATVTSNTVIVPVRYTVSNGSSLTGNCFLAIPSNAGVTVDSVKVKTSGALVPSVPGSNIYQLGAVGGNGATRDYDVYTHVTLCSNSTLDIYADRTPCTGYPTSWASYGCQPDAKKSTFSYITFSGELQMSDSLYSTQKDMCTADTVQFNVINSQTQKANNIKVGFKLPLNMILIPGQTQVKYGTAGTWTTTPDPVLSAGTYTWTQAASDTLRAVGDPLNTMYVRVGINTQCGYVSGSQITSTINGNVACGPVTSLFNTNPLPLNINGAPSLSYFTNPKLALDPITCGSTGTNARVSLRISGGPTGAADSVRVLLPKEYDFLSYNAAAAGAHNAPSAQPAITVHGDGSRHFAWAYPAGVVGGDSIVFNFKYQEVIAANNCTVNPTNKGSVSTLINSNVFCASLGANCIVSIPNGTDTVQMQSLKPSLSPIITSITLFKNCIPSCAGTSKLQMAGTIANSGSAAITAGTTTTMELFIDLNNNGVVDAGDAMLPSFVTTSAIPMGGSLAFTYLDSIANPFVSCGTNCGTNILARFNSSPAAGVAQCLCDTNSVTKAIPIVVLPIQFNSFSAKAIDCDKVALEWITLTEMQNNLSFDIQRSTNGVDFRTIKHVKGSGQANGNTYRETVSMEGERAYFRLAMIEDGVKTYTTVLAVSNPCGKQAKNIVYPNPVQGTLTVELKAGHVGVTMKLFTVDGREIYSVAKTEAVNEIDMSKFASGMYILRILKDGVMIDQFKISKN